MIDSKAKREQEMYIEISLDLFLWRFKRVQRKRIRVGGMGTKIQANAFFREYHSVIDLNGSTSNGMMSVYHENQISKNGQVNDSFPSLICKSGYSGYDLEKARQTILEHESIFRNQLQELHRLYGRQQELMNEIKRREINKNDLKEEKCRLSSFFSPEEAKRKWNNACRISSLHSMPGCPSKSGTNSKLFPSLLENKSVPVFPSTQERYFKLPGVENTSENTNHHRITKLSLGDVQTSQLNADASTFNLYTGLTLSRGEISANPCSSFNLATKDFFQSSLDGMNGESCPSGLRNGRSGKEHQSGDYAEKRRFDEHSSVEDFFSGKSRASPHSNCPYMGTSVSRRKNKIFGVEISEGNDDPFNTASNTSSTVDPKIGPHQENHRVVSSWVANSCMKNLELGGTNTNDGKNKVSMADSKGEISSRKRFSCHSDTNGKRLEGCSSVGLNSDKVPYQCTLTDPEKCFTNDTKSQRAEVLKQNSEHSQRFQQRDFQSNQENPEGGLPWFLKTSQVSGDRSKSKNNSYFMNLDSLQNCSQKFFGKSEIAKGAFPTLKQKKEISAPIVAQDAEKIIGFPKDNLSEANCSVVGGDSAKKVEIDENVQTNQLETKDLVLHKGLNNYIADLRHHIDLNLSLDEEDALSAPSLPIAVVKIATTEIDLEAPAVIEPETKASPEKVNSTKIDVSYEECDKTAAEAMIAISLSAKKNPADDTDRLKWFADIISSQCGGTDRSGAREEEEEESIPDGMDDFEYMTLKLEDTKEEQHCYEPIASKIPSDDEMGAKLSKLSRRGRGRRKRDFQREILPGLVTLSRVEVTEDFQTFEELMKGEEGSTRPGRGRKRLGGRITSPKTKALRPARPKQQLPVCQLEERSLSGWGKRTRRLPRQRCANAIISFPVKC